MTHRLNDTPLFPNAVYDHLPQILKEACNQFSDARERDVFLTSSLCVLSGCLTGIQGKYGKEWVHPNLYTMIVAPPGSGKQVMKYGRLFAESLRKKCLTEKSIAEDIALPMKSADVEKAKGPVYSKISETELSRGDFHLLIPGNTSAAMIYQHLKANDGIGIICETEADTLTNSFKQDWGNFSHLLRGAFHHEPLSFSRKLNFEYFEINKPCLSVVLTGTPSQVGSLIDSSEDGLMSRFIFYIYNSELKWRSQKPCDNCQDLTDFMKTRADEICRISEKLNKTRPHFKLTAEQFDQLDNYFNEKVEEMEGFGLQHARGSITRLGIIAFRICMILSVIRTADRLGELQVIPCDDIDLSITLNLVDTYFDHSIEVYNLLPKNQVVIKNPGMSSFYGFLPPEEFTYAKAEEIGKSRGHAGRTVRNYLKELVARQFLTQISHGHYQKPKSESNDG